jgi:RNase H
VIKQFVCVLIEESAGPIVIHDFFIVSIAVLAHFVYNTVQLQWVPGHCDFDGNEKADELARQ